ncbi:hypothetical protein RB195_018527 [Necator americanus]|uniref:BLOC-1-related complex subunit 7 n=1 Tax=Necator americanus TaxID=51031 RepID=A0ABR1CDV8_NECAM
MHLEGVETSRSLAPKLGSSSQQLKSITKNIASIFQLVGSVSGPTTNSLGDVLERSATTLEELNTLCGSVVRETSSIYENLRSIESQLSQLDNLWLSIDRAVEFVAQKKQQLIN